MTGQCDKITKMPDRRRHRGPNPKDKRDFAPARLLLLRIAGSDLAWLLSHGYPWKPALQLVGNRYSLTERQRIALQRTTVADSVRDARLESRADLGVALGRPLLVDGFSVLLTVESALGGGIVLGARDHTFRDLALMKGHYKRVEETRTALELLGVFLAEAGCTRVDWFLDRPISNSGRLRKLMIGVAAEHNWPWTVELATSLDRILADSGELVATADGWILDHSALWLNLARHVIEGRIPGAWIVDFFPARGKRARTDSWQMS
jgi:hypothetical protein